MSEPILTREQMRAYDAFAIDQCHVPGVVLMENAGRGAAEVIAAQGTFGPVAVICGTGNNGGDGFVVARHLLARGIYTEVVLVGSPEMVAGDAKLNLDAWLGLGGPTSVVEDDDADEVVAALETATLVVDALFGTGLSRPIKGRYEAAVTAINEAEAPVFALDLPSGIDANTGQVLGAAVRADATLTFARCKAGLFQGAGATHTGQLSVVDLGIPDARVLAEVGMVGRTINAAEVAAAVGPREVDTHKYRAGSVLVIAGSEGKLGAAWLTARGVLRSGAGLATVASWPEAITGHAPRLDEVMTAAIDPDDVQASLTALYDRKAALAIGPGLGTNDLAKELIETAVQGFEGPAVLDADAITCFAGRPELLRKAPGPRVLTPHAGELGRLLGKSSAEIEAHRFASVREAASVTGCTVVLKGPNTVVASPGESLVSVCTEGGPVLATAGSGDVLTGVVAAMLCHLEPADAAKAAVLLHARSGDRQGRDRGSLASEIADGIPAALASLSE